MLAGRPAPSGTREDAVPTETRARVERVEAEPRPRWLDAFGAVVGALTALVAAFLLLRLHAWPPHEDEALALTIAREPLGDVLGTVLGERGGAPLHFLLAHLAAAVSPGFTALRLLSVAFAVASVPVIAALVARLTDRATAFVATTLAATSWIFLFHGVYGRMYSLFLFTTALSFLLLLRALDGDGWGRWGAWAAAMLATLATQPYGVLVLAAQALFVALRRVRRRFPLVRPLVALAAVSLLALPLWRSYFLLSGRFEPLAGDTRPVLGSPLDVLEHLVEAVGDFTAGWIPALAIVGAASLAGFIVLARSRADAALLAAAALLVPLVALSLAQAASTIYPESRHLIFALPFVAMLVAAALVWITRRTRAASPALLALGVAALVSTQTAWGWDRTPALFRGEPQERTEARRAAAEWLAATAEPTDVAWSYDPLFVEAEQEGAPRPAVNVPRADPALAVEVLEEAEPLGRGVWIHDASDPNSWVHRLAVEERSAGPDYEARAFGPFLVVRSEDELRTAEAFLRATVDVQRLGTELEIANADLSYRTAAAALRELERR